MPEAALGGLVAGAGTHVAEKLGRYRGQRPPENDLGFVVITVAAVDVVTVVQAVPAAVPVDALEVGRSVLALVGAVAPYGLAAISRLLLTRVNPPMVTQLLQIRSKVLNEDGLGGGDSALG